MEKEKDCRYRTEGPFVNIKNSEAPTGIATYCFVTRGDRPSSGKPFVGCQVLASSALSPADPECRLPEASDNDCPLALFAQGIIALEEAFLRLNELRASSQSQP